MEDALDDPSFASVVQASLDDASGTWSAQLGVLSDGSHTLYARARRDSTTSAVASRAFTVAPDARIEWQVVTKNAAVDPGTPRLTHRAGRPYHLPAPDRVICGMALPVAPT